MSLVRNRVILVDDDATTLKTLGIALESRGFEVVLRNSAIGTSSVVLEKRPEVAILDVEMPGLNGDKLVPLLKKNGGAEMPWFIFHSSLSQTQLDRLVDQTGAAGAIRKTDLQSFLKGFESLLTKLRGAPVSSPRPTDGAFRPEAIASGALRKPPR
jgi:CheY-like chemotaxis protein